MEIKIEGMQRIIDILDPDKFRKALTPSINRALSSTRTEASRLIRKEKGWKIKKKDLDSRISFTKATKSKHHGVLYVNDGGHNSISLTYFGAKEVRHLKGRVRVQTRHVGKVQQRTKAKSGVHVQVKRGGKKAHYPNAFIATMKSGHIGVFRNIENGKWTGKIREIRTVSPATMFKGIKKFLEKHALKVFIKEFRHNYQRALKKIK